jgi:CBS domain-containing protein
MDVAALERIDSFPYRHRANELMSSPVVAIASSRPVVDAARLMADKRVSSVLVLDAARCSGILTERDVLRLAAAGADLAMPVSATMSTPVHTIEAEAPVYRAIARMARLGVRHLPVVDDENRPVGMLTAGALLKQRASLALTLGDEIATAGNGAALRAQHARLPALAIALRGEGVSAVQVSAVISGITRDLTSRASELALGEMQRADKGNPPAPWCLLVLGSAGRGESLLAPDQDNALIHDGAPGDDPWFEVFGQRINRLLDEAGVPYCRGGVMARNQAWRRTLAGWRESVDGWVARPHPEALLGVDIFHDFVPVAGDRRLAVALREHARGAAGRSPAFLRLLAASGENVRSATDLLGRFRTREGRIDLKLHGLFPIVAGARAVALAWGSAATSTDARLADAAARGAFAPDAAQSAIDARAVVVEAILDQQLADLAADRVPGTTVEPKRLGRRAGQRLRAALGEAERMPELVREAIGNRPVVGSP